jgi:hypothetical protein
MSFKNNYRVRKRESESMATLGEEVFCSAMWKKSQKELHCIQRQCFRHFCQRALLHKVEEKTRQELQAVAIRCHRRVVILLTRQ